MKKQKICMIGGRFDWFTTAKISKLDCDIDLITGIILIKKKSLEE